MVGSFHPLVAAEAVAVTEAGMEVQSVATEGACPFVVADFAEKRSTFDSCHDDCSS